MSREPTTPTPPPPADERIVRRALADMIDALEGPPDDWRARVMAGVAGGSGPRPTPSRRPRWALALPAVAVAAVLLLLLRPRPPARDGHPPLALETRILAARHATPLRGESARVGDRLVIGALSAGAAAVELRVYADDAPLFRCGPGDCPRRGDRVEALVAMLARGRYRAVAIQRPPASTARPHSFSADLAALRQAGAVVEISPPIDVH